MAGFFVTERKERPERRRRVLSFDEVVAAYNADVDGNGHRAHAFVRTA